MRSLKFATYLFLAALAVGGLQSSARAQELSPAFPPPPSSGHDVLFSAAIGAELPPPFTIPLPPLPPGAPPGFGMPPLAFRAFSPRSEMPNMMFVALVNNPLLDDQIEKIAALRNAMEAENGASIAKLRSLHFELSNALSKSQIDSNQVETLKAQIVSQHLALHEHRLDYMLSVAKVMTPEQRKEIKTKMDKVQLGLNSQRAIVCPSHLNPIERKENAKGNAK